MKALIASACVAVIAMAGYFFIGEYRGSVAQAKVDKAAAFRSKCLDNLYDIAGPNGNTTLLANCMMRGVVTDADIEQFKQRSRP